MKYDFNLVEETIKNQVARDFFVKFDTTQHIKNIDFMVADKTKSNSENYYYLWAEAKKGNKADIYESFVQLILTVGKMNKVRLRYPSYFGAFDAEKFAILPFYDIMSVFTQNDFNWNVTSSNHETKEFKQLYAMAKDTLERNSLIFYYDKHEKELKEFIKANFVLENTSTAKIQVNKQNFKNVYLDWVEQVKPNINCAWEEEKPDILDADFFIADLLSQNNKTEEIRENLRILLQSDKYRVTSEVLTNGRVKRMFEEFHFTDEQKAHQQFWNKYERPPKRDVQDYVIERRDLLLPQDIRERKGAYFTPRIWVKKAQEYLAQALGENYQDEYYIWDCAAGSGNLLVGLTDKYKIFASTLDAPDVDGMIDRIKDGTLDLLEAHTFQFDFLNDDFSKCPPNLQAILKDEKKRERLIIFINPPYAEATSANTPTGTGQSKDGVANSNKTYTKYLNLLGRGANELFAQFFIRIQQEIPNCILASFSTLKYVNSQNFAKFRQEFKAEFLKGFMCPASTFDNNKDKKSSFPIGFLIWDTKIKSNLKEIQVDIFERNGEFCGKKGFYVNKKNKVILNWLQNYYDQQGDKEPNSRLAYLVRGASDFQSNNIIFISQQPSRAVIEHSQTNDITAKNLIPNCIFYAVRKAIKATWLNDRDQFLYPNDKWQEDSEFQNDCLAFTLFHGQNRISCHTERSEVSQKTIKEIFRSAQNDKNDKSINHFIPFTENEVGARESFQSHFMTNFMSGKIKAPQEKELKKAEQGGFDDESFYNKESNSPKALIPAKPLKFSKEAKAVFDAGREIWKYYHSKCDDKSYNANASLYDIKAHFKGKTEKNGKSRVNQKSKDEHFNTLMKNLKENLDILATKITSKIYEYGFLRE